jgi:hypothetical protein
MEDHLGFLGDPVDIVVYDDTLDLAEIQPFAREYAVHTASEVRAISRWGGPAAGPPEWAGPETAVVVVLTYHLLKHVTSDAYGLVKQFLTDTYAKIRTRTHARWYISGALAVTAVSEDGDTRVTFCLPEGLTPEQLRASIERIELDALDVLAEWEKAEWLKHRKPGFQSEVKVSWNDKEQRWCPSPSELEATLKEYGIV